MCIYMYIHKFVCKFKISGKFLCRLHTNSVVILTQIVRYISSLPVCFKKHINLCCLLKNKIFSPIVFIS